MNRPHDVVVLGTGAFAGALVRALAQRASGPTRVHLVSRDRDRARNLAGLAQAHAVLADRPVRFRCHRLDVGGGADLRPLLARHQPHVLVVCTSDVSPAETRGPASAWTGLVRAAGFGVTLPLQAATALRAASASAEASPRTAVVNACLPDAVNPLLYAAGLPVRCGLGNVATLAGLLRRDLLLGDESRLKVLAHHALLHSPPTPADEARAWLDDEPLTTTYELLERGRRHPRADLNEIGAVAGAAVVDAFAHPRAPRAAHVPAPDGLPGGYPVLLTGHDIALRLPPGLSARQAVARNEQWSGLDGVTVDRRGEARFTPTALRALRGHWPDAPAVFAARDVEELRTRQLALRDRLRGLPQAPVAIPL
ncbi:potassium transporter TrkA [Streptomyces sp. MNP-20]|uniref:potassium transporter TrkA n=1 Tax=Streptomyces sp. MNP-20 TaxID=2721165 RepID=UPI0015565EDF|nr:potassium transporter TrkA [Streptomyces sp. MNP-20]